jgi:predicted transcriptional regulator
MTNPRRRETARPTTVVIRYMLARMTMLSFRVPDEEANAVQHWADALGVDRSEILRDALHRHLVVLSGEADADRWQQQPATDTERSLEAIADWGPAEDWSDWDDAAR